MQNNYINKLGSTPNQVSKSFFRNRNNIIESSNTNYIPINFNFNSNELNKNIKKNNRTNNKIMFSYKSNIIQEKVQSKNNLNNNIPSSKNLYSIPKYSINKSIQHLTENAKNKLSEENLYLYSQIINFLEDKYISLNLKINRQKNKSYLNSQLNSLRLSNTYRKYNNYISNILIEENEKSQRNEWEILLLKNKIDLITQKTEILFNNINSDLLSEDLIKSNFLEIIENIRNLNNENNDYIIDKPRQMKKCLSVDNVVSINVKPNRNLVIKKEENNLENLKENSFEKKNNFWRFTNSYNPLMMSEKINTNYFHHFFNFKKNNEELKYIFMSKGAL